MTTNQEALEQRARNYLADAFDQGGLRGSYYIINPDYRRTSNFYDDSNDEIIDASLKAIAAALTDTIAAQSTPAAMGELPELPRSYGEHCVYDSVRVMREPGYTADQMRAYGQACALSARTAPVEGDAWADFSRAELIELVEQLTKDANLRITRKWPFLMSPGAMANKIDAATLHFPLVGAIRNVLIEGQPIFIVPATTAPAVGDDARDAERYRFIAADHSLAWEEELDAAIDTARTVSRGESNG